MNYRTYMNCENTQNEAVEYLKTCEKPINYYLEIGDYITTSTTLNNSEAADLVANDDLIIGVVEYDDCVEIVKGYSMTGTYRNELKERGLTIL